jgi:hypothetical protein
MKLTHLLQLTTLSVSAFAHTAFADIHCVSVEPVASQGGGNAQYAEILIKRDERAPQFREKIQYKGPSSSMLDSLLESIVRQEPVTPEGRNFLYFSSFKRNLAAIFELSVSLEPSPDGKFNGYLMYSDGKQIGIETKLICSLR